MMAQPLSVNESVQMPSASVSQMTHPGGDAIGMAADAAAGLGLGLGPSLDFAQESRVREQWVTLGRLER